MNYKVSEEHEYEWIVFRILCVGSQWKSGESATCG